MSTNTKGLRGGYNSVEQPEPRRLFSVGLVSNINTLTVGAAPNDLVDLDGVIYFAADAGGDTGAVGRELYRTDGTAAGTVRVLDLTPGTAGSVTTTPPHAVSGGLFYFAATNGQTGVELYQSDGTAGGTVRVADLYPGATASDPQFLTDVNGTLVFAAADPTSGRELWKVRDTAAPLAGPAAFDPSARAALVPFSENVSASIADGDLTLIDRKTGQALPASAWTRAYDLTTNTLSVTFAAPPADGDYRLVVKAAGVTDPTGNPLARDVTLDFFVLAGDANRDRVVNFDDLLVFAKNYNGTGKAWADGDFTGNGVVNFDDLLILAKAYNKALPAPAPAATVARGPPLWPPTRCWSMTAMPRPNRSSRPRGWPSRLLNPCRPSRRPSRSRRGGKLASFVPKPQPQHVGPGSGVLRCD